MRRLWTIALALCLSMIASIGTLQAVAAQQSKPEGLRQEISSLQERLAKIRQEQKKLVDAYNRTYTAQQKGNYKAQIDRNEQLIQQTIGRIGLLQERLAAASPGGPARQPGEAVSDATLAKASTELTVAARQLREQNVQKTIAELLAKKKRLASEYNRVYTQTRKKEIEAEMKNIDIQVARYGALLLETQQSDED